MRIFSKRNNILLFFGVIILFLSSCTPQKNLMYFQQKEGSDTIAHYKYTYPKGQENYSPNYLLEQRDVLYITIKSSVDAESNKLFSDQEARYATQNESGIYLNSYVIDRHGEINLPVVGKISLKGLSIEEARNKIEKKVAEWIVDPVVICKMVSFKISILGDVNRPGTYTFYQDNVSIFDVVAAAGDLSYYGNRQEVKIIRKKSSYDEVIIVDLRDADILKNPAYYLQPGDIVYVRSNKVTKSLSYFSQPLSTITSSLSLIATIVTLVFALKK
ncbi:MAG: polysaccharide biosynthesis/export family protein [Bacteroidales bacterium]